ncbi:MAG: amino acid permease [Verrucomicrobiales bacterium]|nr:amino acid permease [Verrucomicrobiales bacterium]
MNAPRQLGLLSATALVVASMIGTGIFTTSGFLLADLGSPWRVLLAWLVGGLVAGCGVLSYGALARRIPESGGEYLFLSRTLHPAAGYVAGWISLLVGFSAPLAAAAYGFGEYTKAWLPGWPPQASGSVLLVLFCALHALYVSGGARVQNFTVILKVALIVGFVGLGISRLPPLVPASAPAFSAGTFAVSLIWISFSYSGWNAAVYLGGEIRDPQRNLPRSLLLGTGLVTVLYLALNAVFLFSTTPAELSGKLEIGRIAANALGGAAWANAVTGLIALALGTSVSSMMMAGPRVYARMAADGCLPRWLARTSGPPLPAVLFQCFVALAMLWSATYDRLLTYIGFTLSLSTAATVVGLIVLRRREGPQLAVPGWPWVPGLFLLAVLWMAFFSVARRPVESLVGFATIGLGWVAWQMNRRGASAMGTKNEV